jgi:hypothetical protein
MKPVDDYFNYLLLFAGIVAEMILALGSRARVTSVWPSNTVIGMFIFMLADA